MKFIYFCSYNKSPTCFAAQMSYFLGLVVNEGINYGI